MSKLEIEQLLDHDEGIRAALNSKGHFDGEYNGLLLTLEEHIEMLVKCEIRIAKIDAAMYLRKYATSNSPFISQIVDPYIEQLGGDPEGTNGIVAGVKNPYDQLINAVESKFPNMTRHETALMYIQQAEEANGHAAAEEPLEEGKE